MTSSNSVPFQETSDEIWDKKYRLKTFEGIALENSREDTFWRVAKALSRVEKEALREDWQKKFYWALLNGATPGGRILANAGAEEYKPRTSLINCFAGETPVLTKNGCFTIRSLAEGNKEVEVLNAKGNWVKVLFKNYGFQPIVSLVFEDDQQVPYSVRATFGHEWLLADGKKVTTRELILATENVPIMTVQGLDKKWKFLAKRGFYDQDLETVTEVFCCEEPETNTFCILNGLLTSNCVLSKKIEDSIEGIGQALKEAGVTLSTGSGIGYNFSTLRPKGAFINGVGAITSGALSYMDVFDALCKTISSAGGRRGAQMGVLHDWHPDLEDFIKAKREDGRLRHFNLSIAISNDFMKAVKQDENWDLVFPIKRKEFSFYALKEGDLLKDPYKIVLQNIKNQKEEIFCKWCEIEYSDNIDELLFNDEKRVLCKVYKTVKARYLWDLIMRSAYEYSEPGILFLERINDYNPLWFAEDLIATNPCGEVPLPQYGACLLGSVNLTKFVENPFTDTATFNWERFAKVVRIFCRMLDNVVESNGLPLVEQQQEILYKRRHGMGVYGLGSALCMLKIHMGSPQACNFTDEVLKNIQEIGIKVGIELAKEKGPAPIFEDTTFVDEAFLAKAKKHLDDKEYTNLCTYKGLTVSNKYLYQFSKYVTDQQHKTDISIYGIRYSHHTSIAPTGTMSLAIGNNVDSGIEPAFSHSYIRNVTEQGRNTRRPVEVMSYEYLAYKTLIDKDITIDKLPDYFVSSDALTWKQHLDIQCVAQKYVDQSISKTINLPTEIPFEEFKEVYQYAFDNGAKGNTVYRYNPETLQGVLQTKKDLDNTFYNINFENGEILTLSGSTSIEYEGEVTSVASLYDSLKEGMYGKW